MTLTVPRAGTIAGAAPTIRVQPSDTGALVAEFGSRMTEKAQGWMAEQRRVQVQQAQLDMTRDLGQARLEVEQIGDPAAIGPAWDASVAEIESRYITADTDPEVANALRLSFQGLSDRHTLDLSEKQISLNRSQREAQWIDYRATLTTEAAAADPTTAQAYIDLGEAAIDERAAAGLIDPAKAESEKQALRAEVQNARAIRDVESDPEGFLARAQEGIYDAVGAERVAALTVNAQAEIASRAADAEKAAEATAKARSDAIGDRLTAIASLAAGGRLVQDEDYLSDPEVMAHPNYAKAKAAVDLRKEMPGLNTKTVAELDQLIAAESARPLTEAWENGDKTRLSVLQDLRDKKAKAYAADPKAAAEAAGLPVPAMPAFDPNNPAAFAAALTEAHSFDGYLREKGYTAGNAIFTNDQRDQLKAVIAPTAEPGPKVALAEAILQGTRGNTAPVLAALEADPVFRRSVRFLGLTGDRGTAEAMLRGQQKIEAKTVTLPSRREQILAFDDLTGGAFDDAPVAVREELMAGVLALYADQGAGIDAETAAAEGWIADGAAYSLYQQSLQRLLGAMPDRDGNLTIGGLQEVNGGLTVLPPGVSAADVEGAMDRLGRLAKGYYSGGAGRAGQGPGGVTSEPDYSVFAAASVYGGVPDLGGTPAEMLATLTLRRVGETDIYELVREQDGIVVPVPEKDGDGPYRFRMPDLLGRMRQ